MEVKDEEEGRYIGDKKYHGYCIDLIMKIEQYLGIRCDFEIVPDNNYGVYNPTTKQWNGLIKQLLELVRTPQHFSYIYNAIKNEYKN